MTAVKKKSPDPQPNSTESFTGLARSVVAFNNQGFRNFKIVTLRVVDNHVVDIQYSDPYANFEAISRIELANEISIINLNNTWENGKALQK